MMAGESRKTPASLLERVRDPADARAWEEFERRYGDLVLSYCRARGVQATDAEDVRQLVMAKLVTSLRDFQYRPHAGGFRNYLRTVIRGEMIRHLTRHARASAGVLHEEAATGPGDAPDELWDREWMRHHFRMAWEKVKQSSEPATMEAFRQLLAGTPAPGVARSLGMTEAAVRKVKQRMSERLKAAIAQQLRDEQEGDHAGP